MKKRSLNEFGCLLVRRARDASIRSCDRQLEENAKGPIAHRWRERGEKATTIIPDCVDDTIYQLLHAIDEGEIQLSFRSESGDIVDLTRDGNGELAGWFMANGGWRSDYAQERSNNDFADLE